MDLLYSYPLKESAPSTVGKTVLKYLLKCEGELPVENLKLFVPLFEKNFPLYWERIKVYSLYTIRNDMTEQRRN